MNAKVIKSFFDIKEGVTRNVGDTFAISNERYKELNSTKFGVLVEEITEVAKIEQKRLPTQRKKSAKK